MKANKPGKLNRKNYAIIYSFANVIMEIAGSLPKDESQRLRQLLRKPAHEILNNRIDYEGQYAEQTMRRYYIENMRSCAAVKAALDIALLKDYITRKLREEILFYVKRVENVSIEAMNRFYVKSDKETK